MIPMTLFLKVPFLFKLLYKMGDFSLEKRPVIEQSVVQIQDEGCKTDNTKISIS